MSEVVAVIILILTILLLISLIVFLVRLLFSLKKSDEVLLNASEGIVEINDQLPGIINATNGIINSSAHLTKSTYETVAELDQAFDEINVASKKGKAIVDAFGNGGNIREDIDRFMSRVKDVISAIERVKGMIDSLKFNIKSFFGGSRGKK